MRPDAAQEEIVREVDARAKAQAARLSQLLRDFDERQRRIDEARDRERALEDALYEPHRTYSDTSQATPLTNATPVAESSLAKSTAVASSSPADVKRRGRGVSTPVQFHRGSGISCSPVPDDKPTGSAPHSKRPSTDAQPSRFVSMAAAVKAFFSSPPSHHSGPRELKV